MIENLLAKLKSLPQKPGVYLFKDIKGEVIYVGKAKHLRNRIQSYFHDSRYHEPKTVLMVQNIQAMDYVVVSTEVESLILENNLIKKYKPRFNVRLRDDKNYQFIKIDYNFDIPQIYTVRQIENKPNSRSKYFGPYTAPLGVKNTMKLLNKIFSLCRNKKTSTKACFAYHLGRCKGVCFGKVSLTKYRKDFQQIEKFLRYRQKEIVTSLTLEMKKLAKSREFEKAANIRDKIWGLNALWEKQRIISPHNHNHDYLGLFINPKTAVVNLFKVRGGKLISSDQYIIEHRLALLPEILEKFIVQYYSETSDLPKEILVNELPKNTAILESAIKSLRHVRLRIIAPMRGKKNQLLIMAEENAKIFFERIQFSFEKKLEASLSILQNILNLPALPMRIEGYDISNIQGANPVGSMVVFENGKPAKPEYRKFKIKTKDTPDDFAMMEEMLKRRLANHIALPPKSSTSFQGETDKNTLWTVPNLIVIDGGKGQLGVAKRVLKKYNLKIPVIGLAKRLEEIFVPGQKKSIILDADSPALFLLQQIRDEAHRFAITFHRQIRNKSNTYSKLTTLAGVGKVTRQKLLKKFGSPEEIRKASLEILSETVGWKLAKIIKEQF